MSLLSFSLYGRVFAGIVVAAFFVAAGWGVARGRRQALLSIYAFLSIATGLCVVAFGPSFLSACLIVAALSLLGAWRTFGPDGPFITKSVFLRRSYSVSLLALTLGSVIAAAFGTMLFSSTGASEDKSMLPTITPGDHLVAIGRSQAGAVRRGQLWRMGGNGAARVIGLPGDDIQIRVGKLILNGVPVDEPYSTIYTDPVGDFPLPSEAYDEDLRRFHERAYGERMSVLTVYRVPAGHYFILNDNRAVLWDSRLEGPISQDELVARLLFGWNYNHYGLRIHRF